MATDMFLKFNDAGYEGESKDSKHAAAIDVLSWSWGESNSGSMGFGAGAGSGKVNFQDFSFTMRTCKASPNLFDAVATGTHITGALLTIRKAGKTQQEFLKIKFGELLVSSYHVSGGGGDELPIESISFNFANVELTYTPQKHDGSLGTPITKAYDIQTQVAT